MSDFNVRKFEALDATNSMRSSRWAVGGKVCDVVGTMVEASLPNSRLATIAKIDVLGQEKPVLAEVVGFRGDRTLLLPFTSLSGVTPGASVSAEQMHETIPVGEYLLGCIVDPFLQSLTDPIKVPKLATWVPVEKQAPNPLLRARIHRPLHLGIKAIDSLLAFGEGQRIGIMAGSGVGKSVLMGMMARFSEADVNVIGLIGERGREVREFIERELDEEGRKKSVIVVVTSDQSPLLRLRGAKVVTAIAEYFSAIGKKVLLVMDSLTRVAQAQREIGLAVGEPPTTKGYPPSVFSLLPRLLERCGPQQGQQGSISGIYTVLVDGDDFNDPLPDTARSILDGHINLSRSLANRGYFPAIDIPSSISRVMNDIVEPGHLEYANRVRALISAYKENYDYVQIGSYQEGANPMLDYALRAMPRIEAFLCQGINEHFSLEETIRAMIGIFQQKPA